ncbi:MAG: hypothetical protein HOI66_22930, partial [Verrucomicrobia bacterium]|nr:hypothetical protein [Verrucomicrobiota bacterium]
MSRIICLHLSSSLWRTRDSWRRLVVLLGSILFVWVVSAAEFRKLSEFVTARDGVKLATDIYLPPGDGPFPTILARTPYNKGISGGLGEQGTKRGLAVVIQDTRGRFAS